METEKETYVEEFVASKIIGGDEPRFPEHLLHGNRELLVFQALVKQRHLEYEDFKTRHTDPSAFVRNVLKHLQKLKKNKQDKDSYQIFKMFFLKFDFNSLDDQQKEKIKLAIDFLEKKIDYFCSYTRKGLPEINSYYENIIYKGLGKKQESHPKEWGEANLLAKLLVKHLKNQGFNNYFIDTDKIVNGEEIETKVLEFCSRTAVLILLAQPETFRDLEDETNWCFREYQHYVGTHPERQRKFLVFKIPELARPANAGDEILKWFDYMTSSNGIKGATLDFDCSLPKFRNFVEQVAPIIVQVKEELFNEIIFSIN